MEQTNQVTQQPFFQYKTTIIDAPLPSLGKIYPFGSPLNKKESVSIREMGTKEEDILSTLSLMRGGKAVDMVLKNCILEKEIEPDKLVIGDRNSLVIALVLASYGSSYNADVSCPYCGEINSKYEFSLSRLPIKNLPVEPVKEGENEFKYILPRSAAEITFKLLLSEDDREINEIVEKLKKTTTNYTKEAAIEQNSSFRLKKQILSINGERDRNKITSVIDNNLLPILDSTSLRNYIDEISPKIDTTQEFKCRECSKVNKVNIPISAEFFWR